jgi:hypothetical protein
VWVNIRDQGGVAMMQGQPARMEPPTRLPTVAGVAQEQLIQAAASSQLANTRKTAENWKTGLAALLAVLTGALFLKGKESIGDYAVWVQVLIGLTFGFGAFCALAGAVRALRAAYGVPEIVTVQSIQEEGGLEVHNFKAAKKSIGDLSSAKALTFWSLILIGAGIGLTWFGPSAPKEPAAFLRANLVGADPVCGELTDSGPRSLRLKLASGKTIGIGFSTMESLEVVESCSAKGADEG